MRIERANSTVPKGWSFGRWNADLEFAIGYANAGVDEPHEHAEMREIYLVARGTADIRIERDTLSLHSGDVLIVEPGEAHTFLASSPDYFHFVLHVPQVPGDKVLVARERLGL